MRRRGRRALETGRLRKEHERKMAGVLETWVTDMRSGLDFETCTDDELKAASFLVQVEADTEREALEELRDLYPEPEYDIDPDYTWTKNGMEEWIFCTARSRDEMASASDRYAYMAEICMHEYDFY